MGTQANSGWTVAVPAYQARTAFGDGRCGMPTNATLPKAERIRHSPLPDKEK